jgi:Ni,Fe-hydrogenase maturation factor
VHTEIMKTLVLAIGNTLLTDEGVGIHALQALEKLHPEPEGVT